MVRYERSSLTALFHHGPSRPKSHPVAVGRCLIRKDCYFLSTNLGPKNVLLVDPDEAFGDVLQPLLGHAYVLLQKSSNESALASLKWSSFEAILLNIDAFNAQQTSALLRAANEREMALPVIAYSWEP